MQSEISKGGILGVDIPSMGGMDVLRKAQNWNQLTLTLIVMITASVAKDMASERLAWVRSLCAEAVRYRRAAAGRSLIGFDLWSDRHERLHMSRVRPGE